MRPMSLLVGLGLAALSCGGGPMCGPSEGEVERVIDGDTVELKDNSTIRYLYVDTPELKDAQCFAEEARRENRSLVLGQTVELSYESECEDIYGRLLAIVTVGGQTINEVLLQEGYARLLVIPPNDGQAARLRAIAKTARAHRLGLWGVCGS